MLSLPAAKILTKAIIAGEKNTAGCLEFIVSRYPGRMINRPGYQCSLILNSEH